MIAALSIVLTIGAVLGFFILNSREDISDVNGTNTSTITSQSPTTTTSAKNVLQSSVEQPKSEKLEKITITIPFDPEDPVEGIMPMGETIEHPEHEIVGGHPGIDFQWYNHTDGRPKIFVSAAGVISVVAPEEDGALAVTILHDDFKVVTDIGEKTYYTLYGPVDSDFEFKVGDRIESGGFLGYVYDYPDTDNPKLPPNVYMIHWEFGILQTWISKTGPPPEGWIHRNRLCPMIYFDKESKDLLEEIWSSPDSYGHKDQFPYLCNNVYHGKNE